MTKIMPTMLPLPRTTSTHLLKLANEGKLIRHHFKNGQTCGKISCHMDRDVALGLEDVHDGLVVESLKFMKDEEHS
eukprot:10937876-Ditylum_brightwellii.AAC.1